MLSVILIKMTYWPSDMVFISFLSGNMLSGDVPDSILKQGTSMYVSVWYFLSYFHFFPFFCQLAIQHSIYVLLMWFIQRKIYALCLVFKFLKELHWFFKLRCTTHNTQGGKRGRKRSLWIIKYYYLSSFSSLFGKLILILNAWMQWSFVQ